MKKILVEDGLNAPSWTTYRDKKMRDVCSFDYDLLKWGGLAEDSLRDYFRDSFTDFFLDILLVILLEMLLEILLENLL